MITLAGIVISVLGSSLVESLPTLFLGFAYTTVGGVIQDRATSALVGIHSNREAIITSTLEVLNASPADVVRVILRPEYAFNLNIASKAEKVDNTFLFRNLRGMVFDHRIEVRRMPGGESTIINLAFFQKTRYYLRYSDELAEYARLLHGYLRDILSRSKLMVQELEEKLGSLLVDSIIDETQGWWIQTQKLNKLGWAKIGLFFVAVSIVGLFLFVLRDFASGYATLVLILLYVIFELPSRLRRD